jgi:hypothetical protein
MRIYRRNACHNPVNAFLKLPRRATKKSNREGYPVFVILECHGPIALAVDYTLIARASTRWRFNAGLHAIADTISVWPKSAPMNSSDSLVALASA